MSHEKYLGNKHLYLFNWIEKFSQTLFKWIENDLIPKTGIKPAQKIDVSIKVNEVLVVGFWIHSQL